MQDETRRIPPVLTRNGWELALALFLIAELVYFSSTVPNFFIDVAGTVKVTEQFVPIALVAMGLSFTLLTGGIDLSVGSVASVTAAVMGVLWAEGLNIWLAVTVALVLAAALGAVNGLLVTWLRITPFVATLGTLFLYSSIATAVIESQGSPVYGFTESFVFLGTGRLFGDVVPMQLLVAVVVCLLATVLSSWTIFGRKVRMIGFNPGTARFSGIEIGRTTVLVYTISGVLAGLAGVLLASYFGTTRAGLGSSLLLPAVAAAVLGGVSIFGGSGSMVGVGLAALVVGFLQQGLLVDGTEPLTIQVVVAVLLVLLIGFRFNADRFTAWRRRKAADPGLAESTT